MEHLTHRLGLSGCVGLILVVLSGCGGKSPTSTGTAEGVSTHRDGIVGQVLSPVGSLRELPKPPTDPVEIEMMIEEWATISRNRSGGILVSSDQKHFAYIKRTASGNSLIIDGDEHLLRESVSSDRPQWPFFDRNSNNAPFFESGGAHLSFSDDSERFAVIVDSREERYLERSNGNQGEFYETPLECFLFARQDHQWSLEKRILIGSHFAFHKSLRAALWTKDFDGESKRTDNSLVYSVDGQKMGSLSLFEVTKKEIFEVPG